jgi:general L-amino acid transport system substrate-binding protein
MLRKQEGKWAMNKFMVGILGGAVMALGASTASAATLDDVKAKGFVQCGVHTGLAGFAAPDDAGNWTGFDVDMCRAVAAAVFGDADSVQYTPTNATERFTALQSGEIDLLARNTTWTLTRDTTLGLTFAGVNYYDGQGFMINQTALPDINSALQLSGAAICVQSGTTTELNLADYFAANNMEYNPVVFQGSEETNAAYEAGRCDAYTTDASGLYALRLTLANPDEHVVLPEIISKEPLGPAVRQGDEQWFNIVKWTLFAMVQAEELGITSENLEEMLSSESPEVRRVLGLEDESTIGQGLGLENDWVQAIVREVGNYGEVFDRNIGSGSPLAIARGLNALWTDGGLQYAPPLR